MKDLHRLGFHDNLTIVQQSLNVLQGITEEKRGKGENKEFKYQIYVSNIKIINGYFPLKASLVYQINLEKYIFNKVTSSIAMTYKQNTEGFCKSIQSVRYTCRFRILRFN